MQLSNVGLPACDKRVLLDSLRERALRGAVVQLWARITCCGGGDDGPPRRRCEVLWALRWGGVECVAGMAGMERVVMYVVQGGEMI